MGPEEILRIFTETALKPEKCIDFNIKYVSALIRVIFQLINGLSLPFPVDRKVRPDAKGAKIRGNRYADHVSLSNLRTQSGLRRGVHPELVQILQIARRGPESGQVCKQGMSNDTLTVLISMSNVPLLHKFPPTCILDFHSNFPPLCRQHTAIFPLCYYYKSPLRAITHSHGRMDIHSILLLFLLQHHRRFRQHCTGR